MKAFTFIDVVNHVLLQEGDDVISTDLANAHAVNALECSPRFKTMLFCKLDPLFLDNFLVF